MSCVTDEMFAAWVSGVLEAREVERIQGHAADCVTCRALTLAVFGLVPRPAATTIGAAGAAIGRYRVTGPLGEGAMGVVLRGRDPVLERDVAIKMIHASAAGAEQRERLLSEAKLLAAVDHPNVVRVYDAGVVEDEVFVAMELITGATLGTWLAEAPRSLTARLDVLADVGAGLAAAHAAGIIHRDIKPDNIVVRGGRGVIVDFGLARASAVAGPVGSGIAGTPRFIAPEVIAGGAATALSDQFAWWTVVEEALRESALPARRRRALDDAIARGRAREPERRFHTMRDAVTTLNAACGQPPRGRVLVLAGGAAALAAGAVLLVLATRDKSRDECAPEPPTSWTSARREAIGIRIAAAGADRTKVLGALDARATQTEKLRAEACRAARDGNADERARALREELCVTETWRKVERSAFPWFESSDPKQTWIGVDNLAAVLPLRRCSEGAVPAMAAPPPPPLAAAAAAIADQRRAIRFGGEREQRKRIPQLRALAAQAEKLGYLPALQGVHMDLADALSDDGDLAGARGELDTAMRLADQVGDDEMRLWAQIYTLQNAFRAGTDTSAIEKAAEATAARLGNDAITSELRVFQGEVRNSRGDFAGAAAAIRDGIRLLQPLVLEVSSPLVNATFLLGSTQQVLGDLKAAQASFDRAYALARVRFGDDALETLVLRGGRATNLSLMGDPAAARVEMLETERRMVATYSDNRVELVDLRGYRCEAEMALHADTMVATCKLALATAERVFPSNHPQRTWVLGLYGDALLDAGDYPAAIEHIEQALAAEPPSPVIRAELTAYLAIALHRAHRDPVRVKKLAAEARAALGDGQHAELLGELP